MFATMSIVSVLGGLLVISCAFYTKITSMNRVSPDSGEDLVAFKFGAVEKMFLTGVLLDIVLEVLSVVYSWPYAYGYCQYWWDYVTPALHKC